MRWAVVAIAAYALFLQSLTMAVAASRSAGDPGSFISLCSGTMMLDPAAPEDGSARRSSGPCAFCGLGHAVLDLPTRFSLPLPRNVVETLAVVPLDDLHHAPLSLRSESRPRAPPSFV